MYLNYFDLNELPFQLTPDTRYFFEYGHYRDALNTLRVALRGGEGFIKVSGEVGSGKTLLCRRLLNELEADFHTACLFSAYLDPAGLYAAIGEELGIEMAAGIDQHQQLKLINHRLIDLHASGKGVVLMIDEAHTIPDETLEALRLITNLETERQKLLQVVLFGQPELDARLHSAAFRQLRQRITFSYRLDPIDREGLASYVYHRLQVAGGNGRIQFNSRALAALYRYSRGIPRLINILAHKALIAGYGQGVSTISPQHVRRAAEDTEDVQVVMVLSRRRTMAVLSGAIASLGMAVLYLLWERLGHGLLP